MFLLIQSSSVDVFCEIRFTFQYVSINTPTSQSRSGTVSGFTFQYVSINTERRKLWLVIIPFDLHSNMFLLIPPVKLQSWKPVLNLHSNMFLLIRSVQFFVKARFLHLHSNMFLLIPRTIRACPGTHKNLHSNMFLLIHGSF